MLVKVEMSEVILLALKTWDQKPQGWGGLRINKAEAERHVQQNSKQWPLLFWTTLLALLHPTTALSRSWFLYCVFARLLAWSFFFLLFKLSPRAQLLDFDPWLQHLPLILFGSLTHFMVSLWWIFAYLATCPDGFLALSQLPPTSSRYVNKKEDGKLNNQ